MVKKHQSKKILAEWIRKHGPNIYCLQEIHFKFNDVDGLKVKGLKQIYHANMNFKKVGVAIHVYLRDTVGLVPDPSIK